MLHRNHTINYALDAVGVRIELLLSSHKLLVLNVVTILVGSEHQFQPLRNVLYRSFAIVFHFISLLAQGVQIQQVGFDGLADCLIQRVGFKVHRL